MTEPTKEQLNELADAYAATAKRHQDNSVASAVAYALRLAANLPSEDEIERILEKYVYESGEGELQQTDVAAKLILERIKLDLCDDEGCPHYGTVHICRSVK